MTKQRIRNEKTAPWHIKFSETPRFGAISRRNAAAFIYWKKFAPFYIIGVKFNCHRWLIARRKKQTLLFDESTIR